MNDDLRAQLEQLQADFLMNRLAAAEWLAVTILAGGSPDRIGELDDEIERTRQEIKRARQMLEAADKR